MSVVMVTVATSCGESAGSSGPESTAGPAAEVIPEGFDLATVAITTDDDDPVEFTMWFAATPAQWHRGLTDVTNLGDADGMLFEFDEAAEYEFYMWQTPMPLDIVFFDDSGAFVGRADMAPCLEATAATCPRYSPGTPFTLAIEVPDGAFDEINLNETATLGFRILEPVDH